MFIMMFVSLKYFEILIFLQIFIIFLQTTIISSKNLHHFMNDTKVEDIKSEDCHNCNDSNINQHQDQRDIINDEQFFGDNKLTFNLSSAQMDINTTNEEIIFIHNLTLERNVYENNVNINLTKISIGVEDENKTENNYYYKKSVQIDKNNSLSFDQIIVNQEEEESINFKNDANFSDHSFLNNVNSSHEPNINSTHDKENSSKLLFINNSEKYQVSSLNINYKNIFNKNNGESLHYLFIKLCFY